MEWIYLGLAIAFEIAGTVCLKLSEGFTHLWPSLAILPLYGVSLAFLTVAVKVIPISTAYAVWAGAGTALITLIGMTLLREPYSLMKVALVGLIVVGVVGLHLIEGPARPS